MYNLCLFVGHNSETPGPICLKFDWEIWKSYGECSWLGFEILS